MCPAIGAIAGFVHTAGSDKTSSTTELKSAWEEATGEPCPSGTECVIIKPGEFIDAADTYPDRGCNEYLIRYYCFTCDDHYMTCNTQDNSKNLPPYDYDHTYPGFTEDMDCEKTVLMHCKPCSGAEECR
mmetsp:Transcript_8774/g.27389  ORF Transcript_8774/g.27389 Transcript_8774/m.27389 type:complete len:129 (+) Transcript_8774:196-582(+)